MVGNLVDLSAIASVGSACSLVHLPARRHRRIPPPRGHGTQAVVVLAAIAVTAVVLVFFAVDTLRNEPETFVAIVAIALLSIVLDLLWKRSRDARPRSGSRMRDDAAAPPA